VDGQSNDILENENVTNTEEIVVLKCGVKLPKSTIEWHVRAYSTDGPCHQSSKSKAAIL